MRERWAGPMVVVLILGGVIAVIALNLNLKGRNSAERGSRRSAQSHIEQPTADPDAQHLCRSCVSRPGFASIRSATRSRRTRC